MKIVKMCILFLFVFSKIGYSQSTEIVEGLNSGGEVKVYFDFTSFDPTKLKMISSNGYPMVMDVNTIKSTILGSLNVWAGYTCGNFVESNEIESAIKMTVKNLKNPSTPGGLAAITFIDRVLCETLINYN